jgi:hypothetical protein
MRWKRVTDNRTQPTQGKYSDWKTNIANDCFQQCVYCAISESVYGGIDNFHIDHLKPRSLFEALEQIITNLFLACAICNRFKSNDWPADYLDDHSQPSYPDPATYDYNELFQIDLDTYIVIGLYPATAYVTEKLYLNRPQLLIERRTSFLNERIAALEEKVRSVVETIRKVEIPETNELLLRLLTAMMDLSKLKREADMARPYELEDVRRPQ